MILNNILLIVENYGNMIIAGLAMTFFITLLSFILGFLLGLTIAITRVFGPKFIGMIFTAFVELIRGTPMMVQLFFVYYALPCLGIKLSPLLSALIAISLNSAAYQSEYLRMSINSIPSSQIEASYSLGLTKTQTILSIVIPQCIRIAIPALTNEAVYLFKYSSIAYFITVPELMYISMYIGSRTFCYIEIYTLIAIIYIVISIILTEISRRIEQKYSYYIVSYKRRII